MECPHTRKAGLQPPTTGLALLALPDGDPMVTLRLFASLREAAGVGRVELDASDVASVLDQACRRFGPAFSERLTRARVWVDGEPLEGPLTVPLAPGAEVALIPPVSGGSR